MLLPAAELTRFFGQIDIYLFDQLLKGRLTPDMRLLDAGCGAGRNLPYFLRHGFDVCAVDGAPDAVEHVRRLASELAPQLPAGNFRVETLEALSFPDRDFDAVIASAVLHFARDPTHFRAMLSELWRVLRPGGLLFARLATSTGLERLVEPLGNGRFRLPDGSHRFLASESLLRAQEAAVARRAPRAAEDGQRREPALHDHVGSPQVARVEPREWLNATSARAAVAPGLTSGRPGPGARGRARGTGATAQSCRPN